MGHFSTRHASVNTTFLVSICGLLVTMDSQGASRRSSACSSVFSQEELESYGLDEEQMRNLKRTFDQFDSDKSGALSVDTVHMILKMMGIHVSTMAVQEIVDEIDEDESGLLEFPEFVQLAAKFLIEEDEEQMKWELKEAFRIYKHGNGYITTDVLKEILREIDGTLSEHNLDQIIDEVDEDESGTVDFDEFMQMMTGE